MVDLSTRTNLPGNTFSFSGIYYFNNTLKVPLYKMMRISEIFASLIYLPLLQESVGCNTSVKNIYRVLCRIETFQSRSNSQNKSFLYILGLLIRLHLENIESTIRTTFLLLYVYKFVPWSKPFPFRGTFPLLNTIGNILSLPK